MKDTTPLFVKEKNYVTREIAGETIIVPIKTRGGDLHSIFTLTEVGTLIWNLIDGHTGNRQIVKAVCNTYEISEAQAEEDVVEFLTSLRSAGLIRPVEKKKALAFKGASILKRSKGKKAGSAISKRSRG